MKYHDKVASGLFWGPKLFKKPPFFPSVFPSRQQPAVGKPPNKVRAEVNQQDTKRVSPLHTAVHQVGFLGIFQRKIHVFFSAVFGEEEQRNLE